VRAETDQSGTAIPGRIESVHFTDDSVAVDLIDGRTIVLPLTWFAELLDATSKQRCNWRISGARDGIHWPDLDEDLSAGGLSRGAPAAPKPPQARS
jgi:hypothetical protein